MNEDVLIKKIINNYGRGVNELDGQKLLLSIKFIVKYFFFFLIKSKTAKTNSRKFKLHLPPELDNNFKQLVSISSYNSSAKSVVFFKEYYYLCLSFIFRKNNLGVYFFKLAYKSLKQKLSDESIVVVNAGPSFFTHLFSYYCYRNEGSNFFFIQHGIYQMDYEPYVFEKYFDKGVIVMLWSKKLMENLSKICKCQLSLIPTYKITKVLPFAELNTEQGNSLNILFVGESINKINKEYDTLYKEQMLKVWEEFKRQFDNCEFYFKPHPRMLDKKAFCDSISKEYNINIINDLKDIRIDFAVAHISTYLLETLSKGIRCFQMNIKMNSIKGTDYSKLTSIISTDLLLSNKFNVSTDFEKNYIDKEYLYIKEHYLSEYEKVFQLYQAL